MEKEEGNQDGMTLTLSYNTKEFSILTILHLLYRCVWVYTGDLG